MIVIREIIIVIQILKAILMHKLSLVEILQVLRT